MSKMTAAQVVKYAANVAKNNAAFAKLSAAEKRVAIAKDAISQLVLGNYMAKQGVYVSVPDGTEVGDIAGVEIPKCTVCGIGAVMVSGFRLDRKCDEVLRNIEYGDNYAEYEGGYEEDEPGLSAFSHKMLRDMEGSFEGWYYDKYEDCWDAGDYDTIPHLCQDQYAYVEDHEARLYAILSNVVENGGRFKRKLVKTSADDTVAAATAKRVTAGYAKLKSKVLAAKAAA